MSCPPIWSWLRKKAVKIVLVKQTDARLEGSDADAVRRFLFEYLKGCNDKDESAWRRFVRALHEAGSGEFFEIIIQRKRSGKFHRLVFVVLQAVFKAQERFEDFRIFRQFCKLGAAFVDYVPQSNGELRAVPKSQSFDECSEEEIRQFLLDVMAFFRSEECLKTLWPQLSIQIAEQGIERILNEF